MISAINKEDVAPVQVFSSHIIFPASHEISGEDQRGQREKNQTAQKKTKTPNLCQLFSDVIGWICFFVLRVDDVHLDPVQLFLVGP